MSLTLDTAEMEARLEERIAARVEHILARALASRTNGAADCWLSLRQVAERIGKSRRTIDDMAERGEFPRWATVLKGSKMWWASEVEAWMQAQASGDGSPRPKQERKRSEAGRFEEGTG